MTLTPFPAATGLVTATTSVLTYLPLTTQFVQPEAYCGDIFSEVSNTWRTDSDGATELLDYVYMSNSRDPRFASCQPSGWDSVPSNYRLTFSPAVCPMSWTAYHLEILGGPSSDITRAFCCAR